MNIKRGVVASNPITTPPNQPNIIPGLNVATSLDAPNYTPCPNVSYLIEPARSITYTQRSLHYRHRPTSMHAQLNTVGGEGGNDKSLKRERAQSSVIHSHTSKKQSDYTAFNFEAMAAICVYFLNQ